MNPVKLFALAMVALFCGALAAQQDINVQYPVGTNVLTGSTVNLGDGGSATILTIRIQNVGTGTNLTLNTSSASRPCNCSAATRVDWFIVQPITTVLAPAGSVDFTLELDPNDKGKWDVLLSIYSDDPDEAIYTVRFKGTNGKEEKDEDCSTGDGSGLSLLMLLGVLSAGAVGIRLRAARA
jgi:hypothetical protein